MIPCNEITQQANALRAKLSGCTTPTGKDLIEVIDLMLAIQFCSGDGDLYNDRVTQSFNGPTEVIYPPNTFHSLTFNVLQGDIEYEGFVFSAGASRSMEFTTVNLQELKIKVKAGGLLFVEYLRESVD